MSADKNIIYIFNHDSGEAFQIVSLEMFIDWLNDIDESHSFRLNRDQFRSDFLEEQTA